MERPWRRNGCRRVWDGGGLVTKRKGGNRLIKQTLEEWRNEAVERFGEQGRHWKFVCPKCSNVQTAKDFVEQTGMKPEDAVNLVYQDCIGRHVEGIGCNWAAYGLLGTFGNGRIVIAPDVERLRFSISLLNKTKRPSAATLSLRSISTIGNLKQS